MGTCECFLILLLCGAMMKYDPLIGLLTLPVGARILPQGVLLVFIWVPRPLPCIMVFMLRLIITKAVDG